MKIWYSLIKALLLSLAIVVIHNSIEEGQANVLGEKTPIAASRDISRFVKWTDMFARYRVQKDEEKECTRTTSVTCKRILDWKEFLRKLSKQDVTPMEKMNAVNSYINQTTYIEDADNWGMNDFWATPLEFFARSGDCEDFAITKYFSLLDLGFKDKDMRLIIVKDVRRNVIHAVLAVDIDKRTYILDNQMNAPLPDTAFNDYHPIYAINAASWWRYVA